MPDVTLNGHQHYYEEAGSGELLVMVHGAAASSRVFARHLPELAKRFHVAAVDLRGMGQSAHVPSLPADWAADLMALIDHLAAGPANVYGASLGGRIALRTAIDRPDLVKSLILDHPIIAMDRDTNASLAGDLNMEAIDDARARFYAEHHGEDWQTVVRQYFESRVRPEFQDFLDLREASKTVRTPTLVMRGDRPDAAHPLLHAAELAHNIPGAWLWVRPNSGVNALNAGGPEAYELIARLIAKAGS